MHADPLDQRPGAVYGRVPKGAREYRSNIRRLGPLVGAAPATAMGLVALVFVHGNHSAGRGVLSFLCAIGAAPGLLVYGVPLAHGSGTYLPAIGLSALGWVGIGAMASFRATRRPVATWRDFWREYLWLAAGVWLGTGFALVAADLLLGRALI
jgi:hypothetical protein